MYAMATIQKEKYARELVALLAKIGALDKNLLQEFLIDLLTPAEYRELALRWQIVKLLYQGFPHRVVAKQLGVGIATVSRGSRELLDPNGGFNRVLALRDKK